MKGCGKLAQPGFVCQSSQYLCRSNEIGVIDVLFKEFAEPLIGFDQSDGLI